MTHKIQQLFSRAAYTALVFGVALTFGHVAIAKDAPAPKTPVKADAPAKGLQSVKVKITGMTCGGCVARITDQLKGVKGVKSVKVSLKTGQAVVVCDSKQVKASAIVASIKKLGYGVALLPKAKPAKGTKGKKKVKDAPKS